MRKLAMLPVMAILTSACVSTSESLPVVAVSDSAGVRIVESHAPQWNDGESWSVPSTPRVTIGVLDGAEEYQLFGVVAAARQSDGGFVVVDGGSRTVRRYDAMGSFSWATGGRGSGPGDFQAPAQVLITTGDSILIWDDALYRLTRLAPSGELVDVRTFDRGAIAKAVEPPLYPGIASVLSDGSLVVRLIEKSKGLSTGRFRRQSGALRVSADRSAIDTLMFFGDVEQVTVTSSVWGPIPFEPAYAKRTSIAVHPKAPRTCIGEQEGPEVVCFGPDAGSRTVVRWSADSILVAKEELETWREGAIEALARKLSRSDAALVIDQIALPTVHPVYAQLVLDRNGNLWVQRGPRGRGGAGARDYLVFDPEGALLGTVALPPIRVLEIGDDYVLGLYRGQLEVEYLHAYDILKPPQTGLAVPDGLRATMTESGLLLVNADTVPLYFTVYDARDLPFIEWAPCTNPATCEHILPNARRTVSVARDASDTVMVFWWRLVRSAAGTFAPDTVRAVPVPVG